MPVARNAPTGRSCASTGVAATTNNPWTNCRRVSLPRSNCLTNVSIVCSIEPPLGLTGRDPPLRRILHQRGRGPCREIPLFCRGTEPDRPTRHPLLFTLPKVFPVLNRQKYQGHIRVGQSNPSPACPWTCRYQPQSSW